MQLAPPKIIACPYCNKVYKYPVVISFNTWGAKYYSDGYHEGESIPKFPSVVKCFNTSCSKFFNVNDAEVIEESPGGDFFNQIPYKTDWTGVHSLSATEIGIKELEEATETDFCDVLKNEINVRTLLLYRYNDTFRKNRNHEFAPNEKTGFLKNVDRLIELVKIEEANFNDVFLAELHREKGDFDTCINILDEIIDKNDGFGLKEKIFSQAKVKDEKVFNTMRAAIKMEYQCNICDDSVIVFDLQKVNKELCYRHYHCKTDNRVFTAPTKSYNPINKNLLPIWKTIFHRNLITNFAIACPDCKGTDIELFYPEADKCVKCGKGNYKRVVWFV